MAERHWLEAVLESLQEKLSFANMEAFYFDLIDETDEELKARAEELVRRLHDE